MENKMVFSSVFTNIENIHLIKDPGMIPFIMQSKYGFESIVPLSSFHKYPYANDFWKVNSNPIIADSNNKTIKQLKRLLWIIKNSKKIDVLNLFFFDEWTIINTFFYKLINPKGVIYVHCDTDGKRLLEYDPNGNLKRRLLFKLFVKEKNLDDILWGVQNINIVDKLKNKKPFKNVMYVPDGYYWFSDTSILNKEKIILSVARFGTEAKRTDLLLEAFAAVADKYTDWKLRLVGTVEESFNQYIESFFSKHPQLRNRIDFVGSVTDRKILEAEYAKAKIFCLPSVYESFGIATVEAMSKGCFVVGSDIVANVQNTNNGEYGALFKSGDLSSFVSVLDKVLSDETMIDKNMFNAVKFAEEHFAWENILDSVYNWIIDRKSIS